MRLEEMRRYTFSYTRKYKTSFVVYDLNEGEIAKFSQILYVKTQNSRLKFMNKIARKLSFKVFGVFFFEFSTKTEESQSRCEMYIEICKSNSK
jgi:hypothetical protein